MCVILVCPENVRPDRATLDACHKANPHGAGVAWREDDRVRWMKGLEPEELESLIAGLSGEIVIHFRWASVGEVTLKLCHPFPVTANATTRLTGHARAVLFHNGTWGDWRETLRRMPRHRRPDGLLSDTRVAASLVDLCGSEVLERLPGRWVFFERDFTELFGDWQRWDGMRVSNLNFERHLNSHQQPTLKLSATCGNPATRKPRK
ncbi:MAG: hypothetical protein K9N23_21555 [Akkermansiaceae bacterium]|nr:hypothetical protein [Akkermansiaceae bacterium]